MESNLKFKLEGDDIILFDESKYDKDSIKGLANTFKLTVENLTQRIAQTEVNLKQMNEELEVMQGRFKQLTDFADTEGVLLFDPEEELPKE